MLVLNIVPDVLLPPLDRDYEYVIEAEFFSKIFFDHGFLRMMTKMMMTTKKRYPQLRWLRCNPRAR